MVVSKISLLNSSSLFSLQWLKEQNSVAGSLFFDSAYQEVKNKAKMAELSRESVVVGLGPTIYSKVR